MSRPSGLRGHKVLIAVAAAVALTLGAVASYMTSRPEAPTIDGLLWPKSKALTAFALEDHHRQVFTLDRLNRRWTLMFFGYTHCPDVCPVTLSVLNHVVAMMVEANVDARPPQVVFVSVDPERDTLEHLASYVGHFNRDFLGVTGSDEKLSVLTRQLGILYARTEPDADGDYLVDHTAAVFLIDPRGHLVALFQAPHAAERIARDVARIQELEWN